jgi:glycine/D-amino acid oxidase-like deaminating enzyme
MNADVAVIGGGIIGTMVAREVVTRSPAARVVVVDRDLVGSGASRRSAGLHLPRGATERVRRMALHSENVYDKLRELGFPIHPLAMSVRASQLDAGRLNEIYLDRLVAQDDGDWAGSGCQYADVYTLTQALAAELRPEVSFREGVAVTSIDGTRLRLSNGASVEAGQIVLAPGPWLNAPAWRELVSPLGIRVKRIVALHVDRRPSVDDRVTVLHDKDAFLLPLYRRGHWLFSYTCREWDADPHAPQSLSAVHLEQGLQILRRYAPRLAQHCHSGRVFCDAYSTTGEPVVQALHNTDDAGRIVFAGAANGSGYRLAPAIASQAADLLHLPGRNL